MYLLCFNVFTKDQCLFNHRSLANLFPNCLVDILFTNHNSVYIKLKFYLLKLFIQIYLGEINCELSILIMYFKDLDVY